jgi:hypothetical protein
VTSVVIGLNYSAAREEFYFVDPKPEHSLLKMDQKWFVALCFHAEETLLVLGVIMFWLKIGG